MPADFTAIGFQCRYRSGDITALPRKFYNDVLPMTKVYRRAVGFFSSTSFVEISYGILGLVQNGGTMQLITSPKLRSEDVEAIEKGYESREDVWLRAFKREMALPKTINERNRLNVLANLIEQGLLEIKIAVTENPSLGMYHEKIGIFVDGYGNRIAISGSMNESETAISENFESFQVFCDWKPGEAERVKTCEDDFNAMWQDRQKDLRVFDFPQLPEELVRMYRISLGKHQVTNEDGLSLAVENVFESEEEQLFFHFPKAVRPRPHQRLAISKFIEDEYQCLFAMATGTGKTLTALFAASELSCCIDLKSILIIVPLKDLVDQWESDVRKYFSGTVITVRSGIEWKEKVSDMSVLRILNKNTSTEVPSERHVIITTYDSFARNDTKLLSALDKDALIIADEVHKFGAESYSQKLPENIRYRIGLSATPKRPYDDDGTKAIFDYFCPSGEAYEFGIDDAIEANMLCHYNYYPIVIVLTDEEMDAYEQISDRITKLSMYASNPEASKEDKKRLEQLLKERHRIIERAANKKDVFLEEMTEQVRKYKDKTIVFCPDGTDEDGNDILSMYKKELWNKLMASGKVVRMSEYVQGTKKKVIDDFTAGALDMLFAKQRLNEGIDIPAARRAFFIASSTSEREFIQRRGRVLRLYPGKTIAEIFDFIVVPPDRNSQYAASITGNEIKRAMDFAKTADNYAHVEETLRPYL